MTEGPVEVTNTRKSTNFGKQRKNEWDGEPLNQKMKVIWMLVLFNSITLYKKFISDIN
jgi:hypothetical protein